MSTIFKAISTSLQVLILLVFLTIGGVFIAGKAGVLSPLKAFIVLSGSMEPEIKTGSVVISQARTSYGIGDIITFSLNNSRKQTTTHRIISLVPDNGEIKYQTKGDANDTIDTTLVSKDQIIGSNLLHLPFIGYAANSAKTPQGFILLVIIPATIIVYEELRTIFNEIKKLFIKPSLAPKSNKTPAVLNPDVIYEPIGDFYFKPTLSAPTPPRKYQTSSDLNRRLIAVPAFAVMTVAIGLSGSYFLDHETSTQNILGAGIWITPTPSFPPNPTPGVAQTLVINEIMPDTSCFSGNTEAQWLELYNGYNQTIDLKNFKLSDGLTTIDIVNAVTNIDPGEFVLLAHNNSIWNSCFDDHNAKTINLGGQINLDLGTLQLLDQQANVIDTIKWGPNEGIDPAQNQSMERAPTGWDSAWGSNFAVSDFIIPTLPSPGL